MIFSATIQGTPEEDIVCRVFGPAMGLWLTGADEAGLPIWGVEDDALLTDLPSVGANRRSGPVEYPAPGVIVEYLSAGQWIGEDPIPVPDAFAVILSEEDRAGIAASVAAQVNSSISTPLLVPLVAGAPTTVKLTKGRKFAFKRGDTYRLVFSLGRDCTSWEAWFGGKKNTHQENYDMPLRRATFLDQTEGTGYVDLISADTAEAATIFAELELRRGEETNTPEEYTFTITEDIVKRT